MTSPWLYFMLGLFAGWLTPVLIFCYMEWRHPQKFEFDDQP